MYKFGLQDGILVIEDITLKDALEFTTDLEIANNKKYPYILYKATLGYYAGYDRIKNNSIYCGTRSQATSIKQIKEYIND